MKLSQVVAKNVRARLKVIGISATELAENTRVSRNTVNTLLSGKSKMVQYKTIQEVAKALRCKPSQLFEEETDWAIYKWAEAYKETTQNE